MASLVKRLERFDGKTEPYAKVRIGEKVYRRYRLVAEEKLGRPLELGEVVHHKDGNFTNDVPENLQVLPSQRHHAVLEHYQRREARGIQHLFSLEEILELLK